MVGLERVRKRGEWERTDLESVEQSLLGDGVETFGAPAVVT